MRRIGVVTVSRSDYGIYKPILRKILQDAELDLMIIAGGMHLSPEFGYTLGEIEADGFDIAAKVEMLLTSDSPMGVATSIGIGVEGFAQVYERLKPDLLVLLGDRFEMMSAAVATLPFRIPIAHIHGGESTEGAMDEAIRHSVTKMSHLHFASTEAYAKRIIQMGEEPWRVVVSGAPALDNLSEIRLMKRQELEDRFGFNLQNPTLLVTYHSVTLECENTKYQVDELLAALAQSKFNLIFTSPNADMQGRVILNAIRDFASGNPDARLVPSLGQEAYFSMMAIVAAVVGNSSSGIIEAASFHLPVVNIGNRQRGRVRGPNILDVGYSRGEILQGIHRASDPAFKKSLIGIGNLYGDGNAASRILSKLKSVPLDQGLIAKHFNDIP
jgi:GDP/UDP-N,N'-diacetylbacillosamine 2-epimerase (hydrolysing)